MTKQKNDMTIKDAIDELNQISERESQKTNNNEVVTKLGCAIADLEAYKGVKGENCFIDEIIAEHIKSKRSSSTDVDSHWVSKLNHDIYEMTQGLSELSQLQNDAINVSNKAIDDFSQYHENKKKHMVFYWCECGVILVAAVITLLSCFVEFFKSWGVAVGAVIGLLDFAVGLSFLVYERNEDRKQKSAIENAKSALQSKTKEISVLKICIISGEDETRHIDNHHNENCDGSKDDDKKS